MKADTRRSASVMYATTPITTVKTATTLTAPMVTNQKVESSCISPMDGLRRRSAAPRSPSASCVMPANAGCAATSPAKTSAAAAGVPSPPSAAASAPSTSHAGRADPGAPRPRE